MKKASTAYPAKSNGKVQTQYKTHGPDQRPPRPGRRKLDAYPDRRTAGLKHAPKLTIEQVDAIRRDYRPYSRDANMRILAERHGVSISTIYKIIHEERWRFEDWNFRPRAKRTKQNNMFGRHSLHLRESMIADALTLAALLPDDPQAQNFIQRYTRQIAAHG